MLELCAEAFSMIVSDTTGNVKKCRRLICERWGWILNCPDPAHQLNLMMIDLIVGSKKFPAIAPFKAVRNLKYSIKLLKLTTRI